MPKSFLYSLFHLGKIPAPLLVQLQQEGIILLDEGIPGTVTYRNFRRPGMVAPFKRQWYTASIALTRTRLIALHHSNLIIDVPLTDPRLHDMQSSLAENGADLRIAFDASLFHPDWSGTIEYLFCTDLAQTFLDQVQSAAQASDRLE